MFTAIRAETAHSPTYQLLRGELKKRGGRSPGSGNQVIAGNWLCGRPLCVLSSCREIARPPLGLPCGRGRSQLGGAALGRGLPARSGTKRPSPWEQKAPLSIDVDFVNFLGQ